MNRFVGLKRMILTPQPGLFAVIVILFLAWSCEKAPVTKNIGLQLYSLRDSMNVNPLGTLARIGDMGYSYVEAAGYKDGLFYGMNPQEFKNACESNGLQLLGSHTGRDLPEEGRWD